MSETKLGFNLLKRLSQKELLIPYLENSLIADNWPEKYTVEVDSSPYTGTGDGWFHPSSHALKDERWLYYNLHPDHKDNVIQERNTLQRALTLSMGSALHAVVQTQFLMAKLITKDDIEVPSKSEQHHARGSMDFRINHPNGHKYGIEFKTQNSRSFDLEQVPKATWVAQLNCYLDWNNLEEGIILVMESGFPYRMKEFHIVLDPKLLGEVYDRWDRVLEAIADNNPPQFCCALGSQTMDSCSHRNSCWLAK